MKKVSYMLGRNIADSLNNQFIDADVEEILRGLRTGLEGKDSELTEEQTQELMNLFRPLQNQRIMKMRRYQAFDVDEKGWEELSAKNAAEGEKFLAENAKKEGVKTTASGLQYEILKPGTGAIPKLSDTVNVIYKGTLIDGTVFDDSQGKARPFGVSRVVEGWKEAMQMMPEGSKWKLYVPSKIGYKEDGNRPPIGPNAVLVFEAELVSIKKPIQSVTPPVGIDIPQRKPGTVQPRKKPITATTPPVTVPLPRKPVPEKKPEEKK